MIYGISGASGVGKTTVGDLIADSLDITFLKTSVTEGAKRHGYNAVGDLSLNDRIDLQEKLLADHIKLIELTKRPAILDRTPIDFIGYMLAEIYMNSHNVLTPEQIHRVSAYVLRCIKVAKRLYDVIFHLAPLPFYEHSETRPAENSAYQKHCDLIMRGVLSENYDGITHVILNTTDLDERHNAIHEIIVDRLNNLEAFRKAHPLVH